jgi:hypothetical protein
MPDGAVAHISVGDMKLEARWQQATGRWAVGSSCSQALFTSLVMTLLYVDAPLARLPQQQPLPDAAEENDSHNTSTVHRMRLLMKIGGSGYPTFVGSTGRQAASADSVAPVTSDLMSGGAVQCVARGCWGTCLPVSVVAAEWVVEEEGEEMGTGLAATGDEYTSLHVLTVSAEAWFPRNCNCNELLLCLLCLRSCQELLPNPIGHFVNPTAVSTAHCTCSLTLT